jgi:hypothetical protein
VDPQKTPPETVPSVNSACIENCAHSQRTQTPLSEVFDSTRAMGRRTRPVAHHEPQRAEVAGSRFDGIRRTNSLPRHGPTDGTTHYGSVWCRFALPLVLAPCQSALSSPQGRQYRLISLSWFAYRYANNLIALRPIAVSPHPLMDTQIRPFGPPIACLDRSY